MYSGSRAGENSRGTLLTENSSGVGKGFKNNLYLNHQGTGATNKKQINEMDVVSFILAYIVCSTCLMSYSACYKWYVGLNECSRMIGFLYHCLILLVNCHSILLK